MSSHPRPPIRPDDIATATALLRDRAPLVQCLTNIVVANVTANVLLAAGAAPAMVDNPHEAGLFAGASSGVLVNVGTPYDDTVAGMQAAVAGAVAAGTPWVLDPVAVGGLPFRTDSARRFLELGHPAIIRGNASEVVGLAGGAGGRGVDSTDSPDAVLPVAQELAAAHGCVVAVSGPVDAITDGAAVVRLANGHPWMTKVTGVGCALGALMAGYASVSSPLVAATAATAHLCVAADRAASGASGPGSFAVALLDALEALTPDEIAAQVRLS